MSEPVPKPPVRVDHKEPINPHVYGRDNWTYWKRIKYAALLLLGYKLHFSFCNSFEACFYPNEEGEQEFLGLDYIGSTTQLVIGKPDRVDIEYIDPIHHLIVTKE